MCWRFWPQQKYRAKVDRYMWTLKEEIAPELKQELKPFIFDNVQVLFSPWNLSHVQTLFLLNIVFYLSCGKTLVLHTKESTHELTVFFPRTQLTTVSVGQGNCSFSYYLGPVCLKFDRFYPDYQSKFRTDKNAHTPIL